jgi:hypothetical protein
MKCLVADFDQKDLELIFFENAYDFKSMPHCFLELVALPRNIAARSEVYFKKGLEDLESEWSTHKKIIDINREKGGIRKQIPKNFPYFYVDFNMAFGYAHIIEKEKNFSDNFAYVLFILIIF